MSPRVDVEDATMQDHMTRNRKLNRVPTRSTVPLYVPCAAVEPRALNECTWCPVTAETCALFKFARLQCTEGGEREEEKGRWRAKKHPGAAGTRDELRCTPIKCTWELTSMFLCVLQL